MWCIWIMGDGEVFDPSEEFDFSDWNDLED